MEYSPTELAISSPSNSGEHDHSGQPSHAIDFSIIILTFQRPDELVETVSSLREIALAGARVIVVDNGATPGLTGLARSVSPSVEVINPGKNMGVGGRNIGIRMVRTPYILTLDDDVRGITLADIANVRRKFELDPLLGALCFRVIDASFPDETINWCHHRKLEEYWNQEFITDEITEGAVAFRAEAILRTELYPEDFFISHEGPALAMQLMNHGYRVWYSPEIVVRHSTAQGGRANWRRYYYDTRNVIWLAVRYLPLGRAFSTVTRGVGAMLVYSLRDSHFRFWIKGCWDGLTGIRRQYRKRIPPHETTRAILKDLDRDRPGLSYLLKRRLFQRDVRI